MTNAAYTKQRLIRTPQRGCALTSAKRKEHHMMERIAHYRELAARFRQWAESETVPEARDGMLDRRLFGVARCRHGLHHDASETPT